MGHLFSWIVSFTVFAKHEGKTCYPCFFTLMFKNFFENIFICLHGNETNVKMQLCETSQKINGIIYPKEISNFVAVVPYSKHENF